MARYNEQIAGKLMSDLMADFNLSREQAAGIVGNLIHESGGFKSLQEIAPTVKGSRGGYGYAQWTASRRRDFEDFVDDKDWDITSYQANYGNLKRELQGEYSYVIDRIRATETPKQSAKIFERDFERPGVPHSAARAKHANDVYYNTRAGFVAPFPTERGVSVQSDLVRRQMLDPFSGDMGLVERQEPAWSDQFALGPRAAPKSAIPQTPAPQPGGFYESAHPIDGMGFATEPPQSALNTRNDFPIAPAAPRTAPQSRLDKSFTRSVPMGPESALTPGTSNTARAEAARQMAESMRQAGVRGLDGQAAPQSAIGRERYGAPHVEHGLSTPPPQSNLFAPRAAVPAVKQAVPRSSLSDTRLADSLGLSVGPAPISRLGSIPTPTPRPTPMVAPKSAFDVPVPTPRPAQTGVPQSRLQSPVAAGQSASRQSVQSPTVAPPISYLDNPMTGWDPMTDKPAPRSSVGQKYGVPTGRAVGAVAGGALAGPLGAAVGNALGKSIAQNQTRKGFFPAAPFAPANTYPVAPKAPPKSNFAGGPGSNGLSSYGDQARSDSGQFADAWSGGGLGLY